MFGGLCPRLPRSGTSNVGVEGLGFGDILPRIIWGCHIRDIIIRAMEMGNGSCCLGFRVYRYDPNNKQSNGKDNYSVDTGFTYGVIEILQCMGLKIPISFSSLFEAPYVIVAPGIF